MKRIALLTSGGDAPGMNAAVRSVVRYAMERNIDVFGIRRGYQGLMENDIYQMESRDVGGIIRMGGTILRSARSKEFPTPEGQQKALDVLNGWDIGGLVVIGGDGSLRGARSLHCHGFPVVGIPASIDNDIPMTEMAIGVDTSLNTILESLDRIKDTAAAHQRAFIIEVMGRHHGYLALMAGVAGGAEMIVLPNTEIDKDKLVRDVKSAFFRGKPHYIVVAAEGASTKERKITDVIEECIREAGHDPRTTVLGHVQRGGSPTCFDRLIGTRFGAAAVDNLTAGNVGTMTAVQSGDIVSVDLEDVLNKEPSLHHSTLRLVEPLAH